MNKALHSILLTTFVLCIMTCDNSLTDDDAKQDSTPAPTNSSDIEIDDDTSNFVLTPTNYPVRLGYVNKISHWWGDNIAKDLGTPGMAPAHDYNYMLLAFWKCKGEPLDIALLWQNAYSYFGGSSSLGSTTHLSLIHI